jgi:hypothetical protein
MFQDVLNAKLPWVELVVVAHGEVYQVKCKVCTKIEDNEKLLAPKLNSLWKHSGRWKAKLAIIPRVCIANEYYINKD